MAGDYEMVILLGKGTFGDVFLIRNNKNPIIQYAMKVIDLHDMEHETQKLCFQEVNLLSSFHHEFVLQYINSSLDDGMLYIVTEFCSNGDLAEYIKKQRRKLEESRLVEWFRQITGALEYIHGKKIIHRDLKGQNIFLDASMNCKLGDFGLARLLRSDRDMAQTVLGTPRYISPEIYLGRPYTIQADIWSLAIVVYELATLECPFRDMNQACLAFRITRGQKPKMPRGYSQEFVDLLSSMMEKNPRSRPTSSDILKNPIFAKAEKPKPMQDLMTPHFYKSDDRLALNPYAKYLASVNVLMKRSEQNFDRDAKKQGVKGTPNTREEQSDRRDCQFECIGIPHEEIDKKPDQKRFNIDGHPLGRVNKHRGRFRSDGDREQYSHDTDAIKDAVKMHEPKQFNHMTDPCENKHKRLGRGRCEKSAPEFHHKAIPVGRGRSRAGSAGGRVYRDTTRNQHTDKGTGGTTDIRYPTDIVTETLKDMHVNTRKPAWKSDLEHESDLLKMYILNVLDNNNATFDQVCRVLDLVDDDDEIEKLLVDQLGHKCYKRCGIQMLHYKCLSHLIQQEND